jgi:ATP-dependent DNA ligase
VCRSGPNSYDVLIKQITSSKTLSAESNISFYALDLPLHNHMKFEQRLQLLQQVVSANNPIVKTVQHTQCSSRDHMEEFYRKEISNGSKGIVLRKPRTFYHDQAKLFMKKAVQDEKVQVVSVDGMDVTCRR